MTEASHDNQKTLLEDAVEQFVDAQLQGEEPAIDEFVRKYPGFENQVKKRIQNLRKIDTLFASLVKTDASDFEGTADEHDLVGKQIGSFEIVKIIGRGGMGVVYLARDTKLKRSVAVKSIPATLAGSSTTRTRFRREAELLASLNHPNIAVIHDIIEQDDRSGHLVLEYIDGETLTERIVREPLSVNEALSIGKQIAEAVSAAHKKGIVHRDLKPGNIKITPEGRIKVLDFGLAKASVSQAKSDEITETHPGRVIGTPAYMSPEQARGNETDHRTDIWSFGCIMYQMLTSRLPFEGDTATDTLARIIEREPDWNALPKQIPSNIRTLLKRCLDKDPDRRLGDISDAAFEISTTLSTQPIPLPVRLRRMSIIIFATIAVTLTGVATWFAMTSSKEISLLVLPFENPGSAEDVDLANGIMDEIKARLAGIRGLRVYKSREKGAKSMAMELGLDYILEGTLLREEQSDPNSPARINPQLIRASDESLVWEQPYIHVGDVFQTSSDLALKVLEVLDITLLEQQRRILEFEPTIKLAYLYYVRGNEYSSRPYQTKENLVIAIEMYERAVGLDDNFALAHARLSEVYCGMYKFHGRSEEDLAKAWEASEKALTLDPDLPEAHWARGVYYYWGPPNYDRALEEFDIALKSQPDNSQVLRFIGFVKRQQGKYEEALVYLREASEHDPLSSSLAMAIGNTLRDMRRYADANDCYDRAISLAPDQEHPHYLKAALFLLWKGSTEEARKALKSASKYINIADNEHIVNLQFRLDVLDGNYPEALARLPIKSPSRDDLNYPDALRYAHVYGLMGDQKSEEKFFKDLRSILESRLEERPNSCEFHLRLGITYAALGFKDKAIEEGIHGMKLTPTTKLSASHFNGTKDLATIYMMVGDYDTAIDKIEYLLTIPGELSIPLLRIDPVWDPLRDHPRFKELVEAGK
ncbi:MAG TPA: hypothetical protein DIU00_23435 [Phycisphaerales bacterium]|nr:hypothetical protein [Phycisphaerales bacterium]